MLMKLFVSIYFLCELLALKLKKVDTVIDDDYFNILYPYPKELNTGSKTVKLNPLCQIEYTENDTIANTIIEQFRNTHKETFGSMSSVVSCYIYIQTTIENRFIKKYSPNDLNFNNVTESYTLTIDGDDNLIKLNIQAAYLNGFIYALKTFDQFLSLTDDSIIIQGLPLTITDSPDYSYRGLMLDTARNFISTEKVKEVLRAMSFSKLNIFHWHITDDENFPFENKQNIITKQQFMYSKRDIDDIYNYADLLGITIVPEFDTPAHSRSWISSEPRYNLSFSDKEVGIINPTEQDNISIVLNVIKEALNDFKIEEYGLIHLGGDEIIQRLWNNEQVNNFMKVKGFSSMKELLNYYVETVRRELPSSLYCGYWNNNLTDFLNENDTQNVFFYWGNFSDLTTYTGNRTSRKTFVLSVADYYLDCGMGNKYGNLTWCEPFKTWKTIAAINPRSLNIKKFPYILGGETLMWGELVNDDNVMTKIFPRASALAEAYWNSSYSNKFVFRFIKHIDFLQKNKVKLSPITTMYCQKNPKDCFPA